MAYLMRSYDPISLRMRAVSGESRSNAAATNAAFAVPGLVERPAWQAQAACVGSDPGLFFSARGQNLKQDKARKLCAVCPVREQCLEYGLMEKHGIWGGLSERQRREVRRKRAVAAGTLPLNRQPRQCVVCGDEFVPTSNGATLCSDLCRSTRSRVLTAARQRRYRVNK